MRHVPMRFTSIVLAGLALAAPASFGDAAIKGGASEELPGQEYSVYRTGQPYVSMRGSTATHCQMVCNGDENCASWAYVPANLQTGPKCELKRTIDPSIYHLGAVSGVSVRYYPNGQPRPQPVVPADAVIYPRASLAPYPGSENWPSPYDIPEAQRTPLGDVPAIKSKPETALPQVMRDPSAPQPPAAETVTRATGTVAPRETIYAPVITRPAPPAPRIAPVTFVPPVTKGSPVEARPVDALPTPPTLKRRKNWTDPGYGEFGYSVEDSAFIPGDEDATAGFLAGAPDE
ncbi:MAG: PAN domain-containing protein [Pseudomonadota bacterium]